MVFEWTSFIWFPKSSWKYVLYSQIVQDGIMYLYWYEHINPVQNKISFYKGYNIDQSLHEPFWYAYKNHVWINMSFFPKQYNMDQSSHDLFWYEYKNHLWFNISFYNWYKMDESSHDLSWYEYIHHVWINMSFYKRYKIKYSLHELFWYIPIS